MDFWIFLKVFIFESAVFSASICLFTTLTDDWTFLDKGYLFWRPIWKTDPFGKTYSRSESMKCWSQYLLKIPSRSCRDEDDESLCPLKKSSSWLNLLTWKMLLDSELLDSSSQAEEYSETYSLSTNLEMSDAFRFCLAGSWVVLQFSTNMHLQEPPPTASIMSTLETTIL